MVDLAPSLNPVRPDAPDGIRQIVRAIHEVLGSRPTHQLLIGRPGAGQRPAQRWVPSSLTFAVRGQLINDRG